MIILQDSREKQPWSFVSYEQCEAQEITYLGEGDYTLANYAYLISIERKKSVTELANNLGRKYTQFKREMEKLKAYRFRYIICEFKEEDVIIYPTGASLPKRILGKIRMSGKFLVKRLQEIVNEYQIEIIYCNDRFTARDKALELLIRAKNIYDSERSTITNH